MSDPNFAIPGMMPSDAPKWEASAANDDSGILDLLVNEGGELLQYAQLLQESGEPLPLDGMTFEANIVTPDNTFVLALTVTKETPPSETDDGWLLFSLTEEEVEQLQVTLDLERNQIADPYYWDLKFTDTYGNEDYPLKGRFNKQSRATP